MGTQENIYFKVFLEIVQTQVKFNISSCELQNLFLTFGVVEMIFLRRYLKMSHRSLQYNVNNFSTKILSACILKLLVVKAR